MEKLLIIDGNSLANRAFYALPPLQNQNGEYSNAIYGFVNILLKFINEQNPTHIAVAFDHSRHTFRTDMYAEYKGTRKPMPDELRYQMPLLKQLLCDMGIKIYEVDGIEADDIIGTIAKNSKAHNIILSGDRDVLQLVDDNTEVWITKKGITDVVKVVPGNIQEI
ncbi:MAG: DNA polymerase I, partial [Clostridia bacterium]|nr:DNA polymerase I [Clostridia bacterium]